LIIYFCIGHCDGTAPITFIKKPKSELFTLVGGDVPLSIKYKGIHINTSWKVNETYNLDDVSYIQKNIRDSSDDLRCEETYELTLKQVTHSYNGNFTAFACRDDSALNFTVNLS